MNSSCVRDDILTSSYFWIMHLTLNISLPINAAGLYCVAFKSPPYMQRYKWCVLHHMFWVMMLDIHITTLIIPDFLFPLAAAHIMGLLIHIFPLKLVALVGISSAGSLIATLLHLFIYRHQAIIPEYNSRHMSKYARLALLIFVYVYFSGCLLPILFLIPSDQAAEKATIATTSCVPKEFFLDVTIVVNDDNSLFMYIYMLIFVFLGASLGAVLMIDAFYFLNNSMSQLSSQVRHLHKTALRMLIIQVAIPALFLGCPMTILLVGSIWGYTNQVLMCAVMQIVAFHGTVGTVTMILMNPSYRRFVLNQPESTKIVRITPVVTTQTQVREELRRF